MEIIETVIIDCGSDTSKAGFAGEQSPRALFPSVVGKAQRIGPVIKGMGQKDFYVGDEAYTYRGALVRPSRTIEKGIPTNWSEMERLWHHIFYNELRVAPEEHPLLVTEAPLSPNWLREKTLQTLFEVFNSPSICMISQAVLSLYARGLVDGIVLQSGYDQTYAVPIYQGHALHQSTKQIDVGGHDLTKYLLKLYNQHVNNYNEQQTKQIDKYYVLTGRKEELENIEKLKIKYCNLSLNIDNDNNNNNQETYSLPDNQIIRLNNQDLMNCTNSLFQPWLLEKECQGVHDLLFQSIVESDFDLRSSLYKNVVLGGGNTNFKGLSQRLEKELIEMAPSKTSVKVFDGIQHSAWRGGSFFGSLSTFQSMSILKSEYDERGPAIVRYKCFN